MKVKELMEILSKLSEDDLNRNINIRCLHGDEVHFEAIELHSPDSIEIFYIGED